MLFMETLESILRDSLWMRMFWEADRESFWERISCDCSSGELGLI